MIDDLGDAVLVQIVQILLLHFSLPLEADESNVKKLLH
jgi:hypothetical protein